MNKNIIIGFIVAVALVGAGGFYGGMKYASAASQNARANRTFTTGAGAGGQFANRTGGARGMGGGATSGQILNMDANSITVKLAAGGSKLIMFGSSTQVIKTETATQADLTVGTDINAFGMPNSDGSINAQMIQIGNNIGNGMFRFGQGGGAGGQVPQGSNQ